MTAVASRDAARADAFADEFGIAERFSGRHDMFASDIEAVYIATPHVTHFDIASEAIAAGKHVLCEKPLGMNEREVRELAARAADAGVFLMEAMWMKFNPLYARLAQLIADGVLGDVRSVRAAFGGAFPQDGSSRWMPGGSTLLDQGIYPVTLAHMLLGRPETVSARGTVREDGVDLREDFTLGYADARFAQGASSMVEWIDPSAAISGTGAYVTIGGGLLVRVAADDPPSAAVGPASPGGRRGRARGQRLRADAPRRRRRDPGGRPRASRAHGGRDRRDLRDLRRDPAPDHAVTVSRHGLSALERRSHRAARTHPARP